MTDSHHVRLPGLPALHPLPEPLITAAAHAVIAEIDAADGSRVRLEFSPMQAMRVTTVDLFGARYDRTAVVEVTGSLWIAALTADLAQLDASAIFMDQSRHFLVPAGDGVLEVAAWQVEWEGGRYPAERVTSGWP
jgi:hypothetical protein